MVSESAFQASIIKALEEQYPGAVVLKTDPSYIQGFPDLLFLQKYFWAALEVKKTRNASKRTNQRFWVNTLDKMSFAKFIYPSNMDRIFDELDNALYSNMVRR